MALACSPRARSVVELSLSPLYHYQFSSIFKSIKSLCISEDQRQQLRNHTAQLSLIYGPKEGHRVLQTDTTPMPKPHSKTLKERTCVYVADNEIIKGNKPISVGYDISFINLWDAPWSVPLSVRRVSIDETATDCAVQQIDQLINTFSDDRLTINLLDSKYGKAAYLSRTYRHAHLVSIVRLRIGTRVWERQLRRGTGGTNGIYGQQYYLVSQSGYHDYTDNKTGEPRQYYRNSLLERPPEESTWIEQRTSKGRLLKIHLLRYNRMMIRTKHGHNMKDKPFDIVIARVYYDDKMIFKEPLMIAVFGQRRHEVDTEQAYLLFRERFGIEFFFRYAKQRLLFGSFQSCEREHIENWLLIEALACWLLYCSREEVSFRGRPWYPAPNQDQGQPHTMAQTHQGAEVLFLTFDPGLFKPAERKKGPGRTKGYSPGRRGYASVLKKTTRGAARMRRDIDLRAKRVQK